MPRILTLIVAIFLGFSFVPRSAVAQTAPPCINGVMTVTLNERTRVRVRCGPGQAVPAWAMSPATTPTPRPAATASAAPAPNQHVLRVPAPAPAGAWGRVFQERERAQLVRFQEAAARLASPPPVAAPEPQAPPPPAIALPDPGVRRFPVWFVGLDGLARDGLTPQAIVCVGRDARQARIENMDGASRGTWCREWAPQLSNNGSEVINNREDRPGTANGRNADILIPRAPEWANAVVTLYGRADQGEWRYVNQRFVTERDPGASINAMDLLGSEVHNLLPLPMGLPTVRAVAARVHGRSHHRSTRHGARRSRRVRTACR